MTKNSRFVPGEDWLDGTTGVGYDRGVGYDSFINTDIETQMFNQETSAYIRTTFEHDPTDAFDRLQLRIRYDDGFVAYINGVEVLVIPGIDENDFDYIELRNTDPARPILLEGFAFTDGVDFTFPAETLAPGEYAVVVEDTVAFELRYGTDVRILGQWGGALSNNGEQITLIDAVGNTILDFEYDDAAAWPQRADGVGASLQLVHVDTPTEEYGKPYRWRGSTEFGGSPGGDGADPIGVVINEILAHTDPPATAADSIELYNPSGVPIDISGWYVSDSQDDFLKYRIPNDTILAAGQYLVFDENDFNPTPLEPGPGSALVRRVATSFAGDAANWIAAPATPGSVDFSGVVAGDVTGDNDITAADIDVLFDAVRRSSGVTFYDLDKTFVLDERDAAHLVETILATHFGDANLDSSVNAADLNQVGIHWQRPTCNGWADGDFTGDGAVTAADLNEIGINWQRSAPAVAARAPRAPLRVQLADAALATIIDEPRSTDTNWIESPDNGQPDVRHVAADFRVADHWRRVLSRQWRHLRRSVDESETAAPNRFHEMLDHMFASSSPRANNSFF